VDYPGKLQMHFPVADVDAECEGLFQPPADGTDDPARHTVELRTPRRLRLPVALSPCSTSFGYSPVSSATTTFDLGSTNKICLSTIATL
jgi:hypothetical protein